MAEITLEGAYRALEKAHDAGDTEGAKEMASLIKTLESATPRKEYGVGEFSSKAIAEGVGSLVDIVASFIKETPGKPVMDLSDPRMFEKGEPITFEKPFGGTESIRSGMEKVGIDLPPEGREPETPREFIGESLGQVAVALPVLGYSVQRIAQGGSKIASRVAQQIIDDISARPAISVASEITAGTGVGVGRYETKDKPELRPYAELAGGLFGGVSPSVVSGAKTLGVRGIKETAKATGRGVKSVTPEPIQKATRYVVDHVPVSYIIRNRKTLLKKAAMPFTEEGSKYRAGEYVKSLVADPDRTIKEIDKRTIGNLPPAVRSGEVRLQALYKTIRDKFPEIDEQELDKLAQATETLINKMRELGYDAPELARELTEARVANLEAAMDQRVMSAMERAASKVRALPVGRKREESRIVFDELKRVSRGLKDKEKALWATVDKKLRVDTDMTVDKYSQLRGELSRAEAGDMPQVAKEHFIFKPPKGRGGPVPRKTTLKEMQGLRSKLLEGAREARAVSKFNTARLADDLADAVLEDIKITANKVNNAKLFKALTATRYYNDIFRKGQAGKVLGNLKTGEPKLDPESVLKQTIGRTGERGAEGIEELMLSPASIKAGERYVSTSFVESSTNPKTGAIVPSKAETWLKNNREVLDYFPPLRKRIMDAKEAQVLANEVTAKMRVRKARLRDPRVSAAGAYLRADPGEEVKHILGSAYAPKLTREAVRRVRKDPSGDALRGLKHSYVEEILRNSTVGYQGTGEPKLSGAKMLNYLEKTHHDALREIFSLDERTRLKRIALELQKMEKAEAPRKDIPDFNVEDLVANLLQLAGRIGGAQSGRFLAKLTGGGTVQTPGIVSGEAKRVIAKFNKDRAWQMIADAVVSEDGELLKALLQPIAKPHIEDIPVALRPRVDEKELRLFNARINAWLAGTGSRIVDDILAEEQE